MPRQRFNTSRVCSSDNYALSQRIHHNELAKNHSRLQEMLVKEEIVLKKTAYIKGAPEELIKKCSYALIDGKKKKITDKDKEIISTKCDYLADNALRRLGFAYKTTKLSEKEVEDDQQNLLDSEVDNLIESMQELYEKQKEARNLESTLDNLKKLQQARYKSEEAEQAFIEASNSAAEQFPQLVKTYDEAGNAVIDVIQEAASAEYILIAARKDASAAALEAA